MAAHPVARRKDVLEQIARRAMQKYGFLPDFSADALRELETVQQVDREAESPQIDLRQLLWASIDNDDSLDLDQLTVAEALTATQVKVLVAVADVEALVKKNSAIDAHARHNTTSVYTAGRIFPMLPEKLSTDLTSLNYHEDRPAMIIEMVFGDGGVMQGSDIYRARVRNQAKLAYNSVAAWLEGKGPMPEAVAAVPGLADNLRLQDRVAQQLKALRHEHGALDLQTLEARPVFVGDKIKDLQADERNRAKEIIEDFMIATNGVTARFLHGKKVASLRRMVRSPKRWERIVEIAAQHNFKLPAQPDSKSLEGFLAAQKAADPLRFPDLSLASKPRTRRLPATSAWPSRITRTQQLPTGDFRI
jgi:exoribonuclease-2